MAAADDDPRDLHATEIDPDPELRVDVEDLPPIRTRARGGMGEVQLCKDTRIARQVAVVTTRMIIPCELRRAERQLTLHAWQLQHLLPPEI